MSVVRPKQPFSGDTEFVRNWLLFCSDMQRTALHPSWGRKMLRILSPLVAAEADPECRKELQRFIEK